MTHVTGGDATVDAVRSKAMKLAHISLVIPLTVFLAGCGGGFDHPLPWSSSARTDDLVGRWRGVEGGHSGVVAVVSKQDDALHIELTFPEGSKGTFDTKKTKHRATFLADLLARESLHVLQLRLDSYAEFDEHGDALKDSARGYGFRRIELSAEHGLSVRAIGADLGRVAEDELAAVGVQIDTGSATECVSGNLKLGLHLDFIQGYLAEHGVSDSAKAELVSVLTAGETSLADFRRELSDAQKERVDPYEELAEMRSCIARRLPGDLLGRVFAKHANAVFSGDAHRFVRADDPVRSP